MPWVVTGFPRQRLPTGLRSRGCHEPLMSVSWGCWYLVLFLRQTRSLIHFKQRFSVTTKRGGVEKKDKETVQHAIMLTSEREQIRLFTFSFFLSKYTHCKNMWIKRQEGVFHANASLRIFFQQSTQHNAHLSSAMRLSLRRCAPAKCRILSDVALRVPLLHLLLDLDLHHILRGLAVLLAPHCRNTIKSQVQH
jgi:hypothetical protein